MKLEDIKKFIENHKGGCYAHMVWQTNPELKKPFSSQNVVKITSSNVRFGVDYSNIASTKMLKPDGVGELPYGCEWVQGMFPYLITRNGKYFLRAYLIKGNEPKAQYTLNGNNVQLNDISNMMLARALKPLNETFSVNIDNVISIKSSTIYK